MDKEDKMTRELLEEGFLKHAPEGFTEAVMQRVTVNERQQDVSLIVYAGIIIGAILVAVGIIYFTRPELLSNYLEYFMNFIRLIASPFKGMTGNLSVSLDDFRVSGLFLGTVLIIALLLGFDRLVLFRRRELNMFV